MQTRFFQITDYPGLVGIFLLQRVMRAERRCKEHNDCRRFNSAQIGKCLYDTKRGDAHIVAGRNGSIGNAVDISIQITVTGFLCAQVQFTIVNDLRFLDQRGVAIAGDFTVGAVTFSAVRAVSLS